jgi:four helix bundle protein
MNDKYSDFKNLRIWRESIDLIKDVYCISEKFPRSEEYNLKLQLKKSAISVALNIAEGKNRRSSKEFLNFLNISYGSLSEIEAILILSYELGYINDIESVILKKENLAKMINSLRRSLNKNYEKK